MVLKKRLGSQKAPKIFYQKFFQACPNFSPVCFIAQRKDMQEVKCNIRTKMKGVKQKSQSKAKQKVMCVPLKL
jgi:hypothetical protein